MSELDDGIGGVGSASVLFKFSLWLLSISQSPRAFSLHAAADPPARASQLHSGIGHRSRSTPRATARQQRQRDQAHSTRQSLAESRSAERLWPSFASATLCTLTDRHATPSTVAMPPARSLCLSGRRWTKMQSISVFPFPICALCMYAQGFAARAPPYLALEKWYGRP